MCNAVYGSIVVGLLYIKSLLVFISGVLSGACHVTRSGTVLFQRKLVHCRLCPRLAYLPCSPTTLLCIPHDLYLCMYTWPEEKDCKGKKEKSVSLQELDTRTTLLALNPTERHVSHDILKSFYKRVIQNC